MIMNGERELIIKDSTRYDGTYVLYRMQASPRIDLNLALYYSIQEANRLGVPLKVIFRLDSDFPDANYRHFTFLCNRLAELNISLSTMGIEFHIVEGDFEEALYPFIQSACCVVSDRGYLRIQRQWIDKLCDMVNSKFVVVEDNLVVPIESASNKREWAARTIRPRIMEKLAYFYIDADEVLPKLNHTTPIDNQLISKNQHIIDSTLEKVKHKNYLTPIVIPTDENTMMRILDDFVSNKLSIYDTDSNHPELQATSRMSPYLHFGMISPLALLKRVINNPNSAGFVEQLVVRRELAHNYIYFTSNYDDYEALPSWAKIPLEEHTNDKRPYIYSQDQLEEAETHDECWNAAMREMINTGYMENTMRMYWGKKIIEWSATPQEAYKTILHLNNKYFLDGRDANSYVGVAWCFGLHDQAWKEREIFGKIRYMNQAGLLRKYKMDKYIANNPTLLGWDY